MILLNFGTPLTGSLIRRVRSMTGDELQRIIDVPTCFENDRCFDEQLLEVLSTIDLTPKDWQTNPFIIHPPSSPAILALLIAVIHGQSGFFPVILRISKKPGSKAGHLVELINLHIVRDESKLRRLRGLDWLEPIEQPERA